MKITSQRPPGKLFGTLFFALFALLGVGAAVLFVVALGARLRESGWNEVDCQIEESRVAPPEGARREYRFEVAYRYRVDGVERVGREVRRDYGGSEDPSDAERLASRYPVGARATCRVDPAAPDRAALEGSSAGGPFLLLPFVFVFGGVGVGGLWWTWRAGRRLAAGGIQPLSSRADGERFGRRVMAILGVAFVVAGALASWFLLVRPLGALAAARGWSALDCTVVSSEVRSHSGDDSTTYSVEIVYRYEVGGRSFLANRYDFLGGSSSGYEGKAAIVERHPAGATVPCYVDPADPTRAVLDRSWRAKYLLGLLPLLFLGVGVGLLAAAIGLRRRTSVKTERASGAAPAARRLAAPTTQPAVLRPKLGPWGKVVGVLVVALFWNGIVALFVVQAVKGFAAGSGDWFLALFLLPFVLIGMLLLGAVPYQLLAAANPRPRLELSTAQPRLGEIERLDWRFSGSTGRLAKLVIRLEGREESAVRAGKSTARERSVFFDQTLFSAERPALLAQGSVPFQVPADSMHSLAGSHNQVIWALKLRGEIARWPDVDEEFELEVRPARLPGEDS